MINLALDYYFKSVEIKEILGNKKEISITLGNIGNVYAQQASIITLDSTIIRRQLFDKALEYLLKSLKIREELGAKNLISSVLGNIGSVYSDIGEYSNALQYYIKALNLAEELDRKPTIAIQLRNIGVLHYNYKNISEAKEYLNKSLIIAKETGQNEICKVSYQFLSAIDSIQGNYLSAYNNYKMHILYRDSLFNEENTQKLTRSEMQFEFDKKEAIEKAEQEKKDAIANEELKQQKAQRNYFIIGFTLVLLFSIIIFRSYKQKQKANIIIAEQKKHIEEKHKEQTDSITYARRLQQAILPPTELIKKYFPESFLLYKPKDIVAGDFYWMEFIDNTIYIAAADCTGHGVPGAMVSVVCSNALNRTVKEFGLRDTGKILDKVTDLVLETFEKSASEVKDGMDISLLAYNMTSKQIEWSGANNPLWYIHNGQVVEIKADKQPVGKFDKRKSFTTHSIEHSDNSVFYLFTDGLPDQFGGPKGKKLMYKRFEKNLSDISKLPMDEQQAFLEKTFQDWKGNLEQVDDVTVIGIKI